MAPVQNASGVPSCIDRELDTSPVQRAQKVIPASVRVERAMGKDDYKRPRVWLTRSLVDIRVKRGGSCTGFGLVNLVARAARSAPLLRGARGTPRIPASRSMMSCVSRLTWMTPLTGFAAWHTFAATDASHALNGSASLGDFISMSRTAVPT